MKLLKFNKFILNESEFFETDSILSGYFHQAIMDVGFGAWENKEVNSYHEMIEMMKKKYGYEFALLILLGKYNQQVGNGGHSQYFDNGFASIGGGGVFSQKKEIEQHDDMIEMFRKSDLYKTPEGKKIFNIMDEFSVIDFGTESCGECDGAGEVEEKCYSCNGAGHSFEYCDECNGEGEIETDEDENEDCGNCDGTGEVEVECDECDGGGEIMNTCEQCGGSGEDEMDYNSLSMLDDRYYDVDGWEDILNDFSKKIIKEKYPKEFKLISVRKNAKKYNL